MSTYPSPCDKCQMEQLYCGCCSRYRTCDKWKTWFLWHWKRFNAYAVAHGLTIEEIKYGDES